MQSSHRFIKGILTSFVLVMLLNFSAGAVFSFKNPLTPATAYAQEGDSGTDEESGENDYETNKENLPDKEAPRNPADYKAMVDKIANLAHTSHRIFAPLINLFAFQIGNFLGTDYIYHGAMGQMLHEIWVISRNLVNITLVFLLLWLALKVIFNPKFELGNLKDKLIMFTLVAVAVNFSWLGTKVVLDAANVVTHVVFAIPSGIGTETALPQCEINNPEEPFRGACVPTAIYGPVSNDKPVLYYEDTASETDNCSKLKADYADAYDLETGEMKTPQDPLNEKYHGRTVICMENLNLIKYSQNTAVIYMTYGMARIQNIIYANKSTELDQLSVGILMSFIMQMAYTISLLALFITMIIRVAALWIFVAFSPFMVLMIYFKGDDSDPSSSLREYFDIGPFLKWAFVPAKLGAVLVVSFIMITAGQSVGDYNMALFDNTESKAGIVNKILEPQSLFMGIGSLQTFIWLLMTIAILWIGVFKVVETMPVLGKITEKINGIGRSWAEAVATLPYKAPILPLGKGGEKQSIEQTLAPLDLGGRIRKYTGEERPTSGDVRRFQNLAPIRDLAAALSRITRSTDKKADAKRIAEDYGFRDLSHMMQTDQRTLEEGFRKSKTHKEGDATSLYNALRTAERETAAEKSRRLTDTARATQQGVEAANKTNPPTAAPPAAPAPTAGPAQTSRADGGGA